jgi:hypothetical protein
MKISNYIKILRKKFSPEGNWASINDGNCEDFAFAIQDKFPEAEIFWGDEIDKIFWGIEDYDDWMNNHAPGHCFIKYQEKYYDSEMPNGVDHPKNLPYYQRELKFAKICI